MTTYPRDEMKAIQARLDNAAERIRTSPYTDQGKRSELAKIVRDARKQRNDLKTKYLAERTARRETLQRSLFGITGDATPEQIMILRDSRDRAATIKSNEEAATKLALAQQAGDTYMAKAIAMIAAHYGWNDVLSTYTDTAPAGTRTMLEELSEVPTGTNTGLADAVIFRLREPDELRNYRGDDDIERLSATTPPEPAARNQPQYFNTNA